MKQVRTPWWDPASCQSARALSHPTRRWCPIPFGSDTTVDSVASSGRGPLAPPLLAPRPLS
eukprot:6887697-Lingulodinium_polyedra.AAC.1